ncbi:hypothetical protein [Streptomyces sp. NBC_00503]|uniref:hypothetical protein n=1 Tax=Streptomyces sp. NBC_00503 TaxID=2903659 RepID=UPI002E814A42|nr:hypothetical protein [Streptomyces sp. NBC_00503]WUD81828.1 hypothetical protein OG490_15505 [Streptomyces sp. NBC_00503]
MGFKKFTKCYEYEPDLQPTSRPFKKTDLLQVAALHTILALTLWGSITLIGLIASPVGAVIGAIVGFFVGITTGVATALKHVSYQWLFHRLICLSSAPRCAVGTVREGPKYSQWAGIFDKTAYGDFDNDEYFDVRLMPHRVQDDYTTLYDPPKPDSDQVPGPPLCGTTGDDLNIMNNPRNEIYLDGFQGEALLRPRELLMDANPDHGLGYNNQAKDRDEFHTASGLHCEAEGDFWVRMNDMALWFGVLATVLVTAIAAGASAGGWAGATAGCAVGTWLLGPVGCLIGAVIGALLGALAGAAAAAALGEAILRTILHAVFYATPGEVKDANVGDTTLGPIVEGDEVAVLGEHVYDGFHEGWHEFHPLMAVQKIGNGPSKAILTWDPDFAPERHTAPELTKESMKKGLEDEEFRRVAKDLLEGWCGALGKAFDPTTRKTQQKLEHRWTIHPRVDGCQPKAGTHIG